MSWMLSVWVSAALLALCGGQTTEGTRLASSGYHLCIRNETRTVSFLVVQTVPHTVSNPCGGWLFWLTCTTTLYKLVHQTQYKTVNEQVTGCCDGYVQVGRYCALSVNRSDEFTAKPGSCPTADGFSPSSKGCVLDIDCPGWQKCCQRSGHYLCTDPASSANYSENGRNTLNATVTVKVEYKELMTRDGGLLNHTRILQAMVTGALQSEVSIRYLDSWPVHPYRTATSLLIDCNSTLSQHNVTSKLSRLLKHIEEVSSVTVEDVNECAHSTLHHCSLLAHCINTVGSYQCACNQGYTDVDPSNPGVHCTGFDFNISVTTGAPLTHLPLVNTTYYAASNATQDLPGNSTTGLFNSSEANTTTSMSNTTSVPNMSSPPPLWTRPVTHTNVSSTQESPLPATTCSPPSISSLQPANVTGTSFCVYWSGQFHPNQTYLVEIRKGSEVVFFQETNQTMIEKRNLQPGVLYNVSVTPCACGSQGIALHISIKTDAQTLDGTARLTNIQFTEELQNTSSQAYKNLTESFIQEIYRSLSPEMRALVDSEQVIIEIKSISMGSVVVNFTIILTSGQSQDIMDVSTALRHSLMNSSVYTVDENSTSIYDVNECASGENDCHPWATCTNTFGSYTCICLDGFTDNSPEKPGRVCEAITTLETPTPEVTTAIFPTVSSSSISQMTSTSDPSGGEIVSTISTQATTTSTAPTTTTTPSSSTSPVIIATSAATSGTPTTTTTTTTPTTAPTTTTTQSSSASPIITTTSTTTTTIPIISTAPTTASTRPTTASTTTTTTTIPVTSIITPAITSATTTTTTAIAVTSTTPTATTIPIISTAPTTTSTIPTTASTTTTTTTIPVTSVTPAITSATTTTTTTIPVTSITPAITSATTTTTTTIAVTSTTPTTTTIPIISTAPTATSTTPTATSTTTTTTATPATSTAPTTTTTASLRSATNTSILWALSVQCRVAAITVTVARDFLASAHIQESDLYLGMQNCGVNGGNTTHVELTVSWDECGTVLVHNETFYTASATLFNNMDQTTSQSGSVEVPRTLLEVPIMCTYMKSMVISADFSSMGYEMIKDVIMGSGSFQVVVQLMNGTVPLPQNYTLSPTEALVVEVSLNVSSDLIKLIINKCWATPTPNPADTNSYPFLDDSCSLNLYTKVLMNGNSTTSRLSVQIFSFVNLNVIYLHCQVQICLQTGLDSCVPDCLQRTARSANTVGRGFGSFGPVLRSGEEFFEEELNTLHIVGLSCLGVGLSLFFIIGFVCLFYYQRNRIGHYNFSVKPKEENFTYLVFNT